MRRILLILAAGGFAVGIAGCAAEYDEGPGYYGSYPYAQPVYEPRPVYRGYPPAYYRPGYPPRHWDHEAREHEEHEEHEHHEHEEHEH